MREIKFRAVLKTLINNKSMIKNSKSGWDKSLYFSLEDIMLKKLVFDFPENFIFNQFTGLKDKNGKEIYEGDIIKMNNHWDSSWASKPMEVKFQQGCFFPFGSGDWEPDLEDCEIVGNIYEHPHLLSNKQS